MTRHIRVWNPSAIHHRCPFHLFYIWGFRNRLTDIENRLVVIKGERVGEGWIGSLGLADANYYIENG